MTSHDISLLMKRQSPPLKCFNATVPSGTGVARQNYVVQFSWGDPTMNQQAAWGVPSQAVSRHQWILPSGNDQQFAIENGHRNSGFTMIYPLKMVIFHSFLYVYQRIDGFVGALDSWITSWNTENHQLGGSGPVFL